MYYALIFDPSTGDIQGAHAYAEEPAAYPDNQAPCTESLFEDFSGAAIDQSTTPASVIPPTSASLAEQKLKADALAALPETDMVANRCYKAGMAFPADWQAYTTALRNIANGTDTTSTSLPTKPAHPAGT